MGGGLPGFGDATRRARLVRRHHLARTAPDVETATRGVVALHSSDPVTPYLASWARVPGFVTGQLEEALYDRRALCRVHAMRRTLWVVATEEVPLLDAAVGADVAARERRRLEGWLAAEMPADEAADWLVRVAERTCSELGATAATLTTRELSELVPELATPITVGSGKWAGSTPVSSRLLFLLAMEGHVVRARPAGSWRSSQYTWAAAGAWLGELPGPPDRASAAEELARRYLARFGPATELDLRWWTGWTVRGTRAALEALAAVGVRLDSGGTGYLLPEDLESGGAPPRHVSLLPGLDPTPMGWKERDWYLGSHGDVLFDRNGNVGPTVWVDGAVVGAWAQIPDGGIGVRLLEELPAEAVERVREEADRLELWLDGETVTPRFRNPLERELAGS